MPTIDGKYWLETQSGQQFKLGYEDVSHNVYVLEDIAHGLANICRYNGQCKHFYSVAQHSVLVAHLALAIAQNDRWRKYFEDDATLDYVYMRALLHDAAEAYLGDVTKPLKEELNDCKYKQLTFKIDQQIILRLHDYLGSSKTPRQAISHMLSGGTREVVHEADLHALNIERHYLMPQVKVPWMYELTPLEKSDERLAHHLNIANPWPPQEAKHRFKEACSGFNFTN